MLSILETDRVLRLARGGWLRPWLGPALRGMTGGRLKAKVCRFPVAEREAHWQYCKGCPHMAGCAYGEVMEPDPPPETSARRLDAVRPVVVAARFPSSRQCFRWPPIPSAGPTRPSAGMIRRATAKASAKAS